MGGFQQIQTFLAPRRALCGEKKTSESSSVLPEAVAPQWGIGLRRFGIPFYFDMQCIYINIYIRMLIRLYVYKAIYYSVDRMVYKYLGTSLGITISPW